MTILKNIILNGVGSIFPIAVLQLIIFPILGNEFSQEEYGVIITAISYTSILSSGLGVSLNNVRLLTINRYQNKKCIDFVILFLLYQVINVVCCIFIAFNLGFQQIEILLYIFLFIIQMCKDYFVVIYLINLNYKKVCIYNSLTVVGYIAGLLLQQYFDAWMLIWIFGNIVPVFYFICFDRKYININFQITPVFFDTIKKTGSITGAALMNQVLAYADRAILFPLMGGSAVAIYYVASLVSKIISLCIGPIQGVFLSYIAKGEHKLKIRFNSTLYLGCIFSMIAFFVCSVVSKPVIHMLYPDMAYEVMKYVNIVTLSSMIYSINSLLMAFVMKECKPHRPIQLALENVILYIMGTCIGIRVNGLQGFCYVNVIINLYRMLRICLVYQKDRLQ